MKDLFLILALSLTVAMAGVLKSEQKNLNPKSPVSTQKYLSFNN